MIVRDYIACATCQHPHIPRVQVGADPSQKHTFNCLNCQEPISLTLDADYGTGRARILLVDNCVRIPECDATPVYLCADFVADPAQINQEMAFPSFQFVTQQAALGKIKPVSMVEILEAHKPITITEIWSDLKKIWRLESSRKHEIAKRLREEFCDKHKIELEDLWTLMWKFLASRYPLPSDLRMEIKNLVENHNDEFVRFLWFYKIHMRPTHRKNQFEIMSEFYEGYDQHSQMYPYVINKTPFSQVGKATLLNFNQVKEFYAKAYEFFAGAISIYACLNNIKEGRPFDKLKNIDLKKYLETDKAKRRDTLMSNPHYSVLTEEFDSTVRNASYHGWFFLKSDNETIEFRSGGTGALRTMTYTEYLYRCGKLYMQLCQLFTLELELEAIGKELNIYSFNKN